MKLAVHSYLHSSHGKLWLAALPFPKDEDKDVVTTCLAKDTIILARLQMLYNATLDGRKLRKEIVNYLGDGIFELKKDSFRLTFFIDDKFVYNECFPKVIVILSCFIKKTSKTPASEIFTAKKQRRNSVKNILMIRRMTIL